ncbi:TLC domain-containing protein 4 [Ornithorhynchus anatinus]|uniref:TLC domain containing 4 n=1 Tax=Ornithorhynchus anatinus TaxID=9258 RepID=K7EG42_ORNAN|nr:TLC domain-containing protein 4 [Ornithorhynchus anatinus]XP_039767787.1 TLC domain-containing protein 4 [Ornithorhynchus anatinus]XP_039767788.1 TLC domain-containing protein 4 [Ornithorhynchus anatinus]XP_039767789.1 TLC domain-containing protein 4 [Ornithorhynchus anatinus]XP_039767790.1 TLC domain-containing protein 4 [Ornithorhynchus anatinus]XP_039767791.1 TLC domain-containing protein 4 [Ornithorhynchus anatinus]XP_039767792.1 TLC domain-containing protein 4 [Ornithorhynchus anatinu
MDLYSKLITGIVITSVFLFQLLFHVFSPWFSRKLTPSFDNLNQKRKIEWNSRIVSTFHALVVGFFCLYILVFDEPTKADPLWGDPSVVKLNIAITSGYLISDLLLLIFYWKAIGDKFYVLHHVAALYAYYFVLVQGKLAYMGNFRLLAEFSTPFVNQRWFFEVLKYPKASKANIINGILMTVVFFIVRIAVIPSFYGYILAAFGTEAYNRLGFGAQSAWIGSSAVLDVMNVMWMVKITKGCFKVILLIRKEEAKGQENGKFD